MAYTLKVYNTESREKEEVKPLKDHHIRMYTCGPTVYNFAHIGNFRTYVFEDLLRRAIKFFGMKITQVMNLTDVDDKTIKGAITHKVSLDDFTKTYKDAFFEDLKTLNIEPAEHYPAATDYIPEMIVMIEGLLKKEVAYLGGDGSIYFAINKFPRYGCLSHIHLDELQTGASERVNADEYEKEHAADFVLWKAYDETRDGGIYWESPFGKGRPGWHLECSAMAMNILGEQIDIHVGGIDNMFPHHENEIAQSEAYSCKRFSKIWMHSEHLIVDGKKMSKSLGNFFSLRDLLNKGFTGRQVRYMLLQAHYKTQLNFTFKGLESVNQTLRRVDDFVIRLKDIEALNKENNQSEIEPFLEKAEKEFSMGLADDLNIAVSLAALFDFIREVNVLADKGKLSSDDAKKALALLKHFDKILGVLSFEEEIIPEELQKALEKRNEARKNKDFKESDRLRDEILTAGYIIEDTVSGAKLKKADKR
ncbi:MAG TPA: cysteine--tRNA ligase [Parachlamydiaceae bacterium]|nr:cysteine--tRNA ligase [Parachlamydiaceae bacterium]